MTPEHQPVTRAELKAELAVLRAEQRAENKADLKAALEGFAAALIGNLSDLREEMQRRFAEVEKRLDTIDRRTDRMETQIHSVVLQTAGMSRSRTEGERFDSHFAATQAAQQRAIDDLYAKVADIQRQLQQRPSSQP
jgi:chromosome segregation ATPase